MIKKEYKKICKRFDDVMWDIGCEYLALSDGKSEVFTLPTPTRMLSVSPNPSSEPASLYRVTILKEGYYPLVLDSISMFEGIYSTLTVSLVAFSLYDERSNAPKEPILNMEGVEEI